MKRDEKCKLKSVAEACWSVNERQGYEAQTPRSKDRGYREKHTTVMQPATRVAGLGQGHYYRKRSERIAGSEHPASDFL